MANQFGFQHTIGFEPIFLIDSIVDMFMFPILSCIQSRVRLNQLLERCGAVSSAIDRLFFVAISFFFFHFEYAFDEYQHFDELYLFAVWFEWFFIEFLCVLRKNSEQRTVCFWRVWICLVWSLMINVTFFCLFLNRKVREKTNNFYLWKQTNCMLQIIECYKFICFIWNGFLFSIFCSFLHSFQFQFRLRASKNEQLKNVFDVISPNHPHTCFFIIQIYSLYINTRFIYIWSTNCTFLICYYALTHSLFCIQLKSNTYFALTNTFFPFYHHFCCSCFFFSWHKINHFCEYNTHNFCSVVVVGSFLFVKFRTAKVQKIAPTREFVICFCISTITFLYKKKPHTISKQRTFFWQYCTTYTIFNSTFSKYLHLI